MPANAEPVMVHLQAPLNLTRFESGYLMTERGQQGQNIGMAKAKKAKLGETAPKHPKRPSALRKTVQVNVRKMLIHRYGEKTHREWVDLSKISQGTLGRALNADTGLTLETLETVASSLDLSPYQLLVDIVDPANPPIIPGATSDERKLWNQFLELKKNLAKAEK